MENTKKYGLIGLKALLTAVFAFAAFGKLSGNPQMVAIFETIGFGQWFRYVAGAVEIVGAALFWVPRAQWIGAALLVCTMAAAVLFHVFVLGPSLVPALVLGVLCSVVLYAHRPKTA